MPPLRQNLAGILVFQFSIRFNSVPGFPPGPKPTRSGVEGIEPLKPLACGFSLDSMGRRGHDGFPGRPRSFSIVLVEAESCAGAWTGFQQVQLISDEWRGSHWETKGWRASRCQMAGEDHGEMLLYPQGEGASYPLGGFCAALWIPAGHCSHILCPTWSLRVLLATAAEGCPNETREVDHQVLTMLPPPHSAPSWVLLMLKIFPKH